MALIKRKDLVEKDPLKELRKQVQGLTKDLEALQKQSRAVNKTGTGAEAKQRVTIAKKLKTATLKLKEVKRAEVTVSEQVLKANTKLAQSRTKEARQLAIVREKTLQQNKALRAQAKATLGVRKGISSLTKQMFAGIGIIAGFRALSRVFTNALKIYKEFEKSSSRLAAILSKNKDEIKALTEQAKLLGSTTAFTAKEVVGLQIELGKLGFSLREIEASTPGILDLAAATGSELAPAAELAGATLRIFNLDASQMSRVTDVLALSTTKSSLSMEKLATILPTVGKTAEIAGVSLEKTVALAGTLTDRGLDASSAATSLRNIFLELSKKGITWNEAMTKINKSTDKNKTSMDLFGKRAAAAGVILSETATSTDELTTALNDANGAAKAMSKTMLDNLAGDITIAESAWEGFVNSLITGEGIISRISRGLTQFFTELVGELTQLNNGASIALIQLKNVEDFEGRLEKFRIAKIDQLKEIETAEEKKIKLEGRSAILGSELALIERKLKREREGNIELSKEEKTQIEFRRDLLEGQIDILNSLIPLEKANNIEIETSAEATKSTLTPLEERIKLLKAEEKILKQITEEEELLKRKRGRDTGLVAEIETKGAPELVLTEAQKLADGLALIKENARVKQKAKDDADFEKAKERAKDQAKAIEAIKEAAWQAGTQILQDISAAFWEERKAQIQADADLATEKAEGAANSKIQILQNQLDKGLISEEQFAAQSAAINENLAKKKEAIERDARIKSAKADKKKALFDIAIATAVAAIKVLPNFIASALILALGGIQAAVVAAKPIPKFKEGEVKVKGKSHEQGGIQAEIEGGESVINKAATADSEGILNMVNKGLLTDKNLPEMTKQDNNMLVAGLLMSGNKDIKSLVTLMSNMGWSYPENGEMKVNFADGSLIKRFNING